MFEGHAGLSLQADDTGEGAVRRALAPAISHQVQYHTDLHQKSLISIITCPEASGILAVLLTLQIRTMCGWAGYSKVRFSAPI